MAARTRYKVTATMIVVKVPGALGGEIYLYRGRTLPETVEPTEVKRLLGLGLIEKVDPKASAAKAEDPKGDGSAGTPESTGSRAPEGD